MAPIAQLTADCLREIINGVTVDKPVLQILGSKRINPGNDAQERYRLLVSDGKNLQSFAMLATQMNDMYNQGHLEENTIVRVDRYITSMVNRSEKGEKRVLIILELTVLNPGAEVGRKIGNPISMDSNSTASATSSSNTAAAAPNKPHTNGIGNGSNFNSGTVAPKTPTANNNSSFNRTMDDQENLSSHLTHPISALTPYQNKWIIRARVMSKSPIRTWSNAKGEGKLFNMDLCDEGGEIRATVFRELVDKYYDMIEVDKVYYISRGQLKIANKQFCSLKNDYEMTFGNETIVQECKDMADVPEIKYNFVPISQIADKEPNSVVDCLGVCKEATDLQTFTAKTTGRELKKREITLVDSSGASIALTLWGTEAENFDAVLQPVILVKSAKIGEFGGGKNLSLFGGSSMKINPDIVEGHKLRGWFDNGGCDQSVNSLSSRTSSSVSYNTEWLTFEDVKLKNLGSNDAPDYFQAKGVIHLIKNTNAMYKSCPQPDCNKKVTDLENGQYRCDKCNADFGSFKYRLLLNMCVADMTGNLWATCFNEIGEQLLGKSAQEIGEEIDGNPEAATNLFSQIYFKQFIFKFRTKIEFYGDSARSKSIILTAAEVDHEQYQNHLIKELQELTGIGKL